jgi:hypothetical protein
MMYMYTIEGNEYMRRVVYTTSRLLVSSTLVDHVVDQDEHHVGLDGREDRVGKVEGDGDMYGVQVRSDPTPELHWTIDEDGEGVGLDMLPGRVRWMDGYR